MNVLYLAMGATLARDYYQLRANHMKDQSFGNNFKDDERQIEACIKDQANHEGTLDHAITMNEVDDAIAQIQTTVKSADPDNIHPSTLKTSGFWMRKAIAELYNKMFT